MDGKNNIYPYDYRYMICEMCKIIFIYNIQYLRVWKFLWAKIKMCLFILLSLKAYYDEKI